jgi:transcriptional regulator with XRE-family HTH domain
VAKAERNIQLRGDRILRLRERRGWNQMEAAWKTHTNQGSLSRIERGMLKNVTLETLASLAEGLDTSIEYLIGVSNDPAPRPQSAMDRLSEDEARWLTLFRELSPFSRETVFALAQRLADSDRAAADPPREQAARAEHQ